VGSLNGKVALVVGASRGMGKQMALELAGRGADVAVAARTAARSESALPGTIAGTVEEIKALGRRAEAIKVDLEIGAEVDAMVRHALEAFGHIDILVYSVQYHGPGYWDSFADTTIEQLEAQMVVDAMAAVRICKLVVPHMVERNDGIIVLVTSTAAYYEHGLLPGQNGQTGLGYPIAKAALSRFVPALAKEVKEHGVAVVGLDPGWTLSEHVQAEVVGNEFRGMDIDMSVPMAVPAKAAAYLCTCDDPMSNTGLDLKASDLALQYKLVDGQELDNLQKAAALVATEIGSTP
jgi:NAD(P)-dependent dehydrogenase (short-subunit alcohol dehydrogenase family)